MKLAILQPGYLPWLGYFDQMNKVDIFVHATDLQYTRQDWRNRNRIKTRQGWAWLTVPVVSKGQYHAPIDEVRINNHISWTKKHLNIIRENYRQAPYYSQYISFFETVYARTWELLLDLDLHLIDFFRDALGISTRVVDIADLKLGKIDRNSRLIRVCQEFGASTYLSGAAAKQYIQPERFEQAGISLEFQEYQHPIYPQLHGDFMPYMSIIDLIFNCGDESPSILTGSLRESCTSCSSKSKI